MLKLHLYEEQVHKIDGLFSFQILKEVPYSITLYPQTHSHRKPETTREKLNPIGGE